MLRFVGLYLGEAVQRRASPDAALVVYLAEAYPLLLHMGRPPRRNNAKSPKRDVECQLLLWANPGET
jgi:hypothetical protein